MTDKKGSLDFKEVDITKQLGENKNILQYYDYYY